MTSIISRVRLETESPRPEILEIAENELRETPERVEEATKELRKLLRGNKYTLLIGKVP